MTTAACRVILQASSLCLTSRSVKSLKKSAHSMDIEVLQLWSLLAFHTVFVQIGIEGILNCFPFYYCFKMILMVITFLPGTKFPNFWFEVILVPGMERVHQACDVGVVGVVKFQVKMLPLRILDLFLPGIAEPDDEDGERSYGTVRRLREKQLEESSSELALTASSTDSFIGNDETDCLSEIYGEDKAEDSDSGKETTDSQPNAVESNKDSSSDNCIEMESDEMRTKLEHWKKEKKCNSPTRNKASPVDRCVSPRTPNSTMRHRRSNNITSDSRDRRKTFSASRTNNNELGQHVSPDKGEKQRERRKVTEASPRGSRRVSSGTPKSSNLSSEPTSRPLTRRSSSMSSPVAKSRITASSMQLRQFSRVHPSTPHSASGSPHNVPPASAFKHRNDRTESQQEDGMPDRPPSKPLSPKTRPSTAGRATTSRRVGRASRTSENGNARLHQRQTESQKNRSNTSKKVKQRRAKSEVENVSIQPVHDKEEETLLGEKMSVRQRLDQIIEQEEINPQDGCPVETADVPLKNNSRLSVGERIRTLVTGNVDIRLRDYFFDLDLPFSPLSHYSSTQAENSDVDNKKDDRGVEDNETDCREESNEIDTSVKSVASNGITNGKEREKARRDAAFEKHRKRMQVAAPTKTGTVLHRHDLSKRRREKTDSRGGGLPHTANGRRINSDDVAGKRQRGCSDGGNNDNVTLRRSRRIAQAGSERSSY
mmetsp:Transcript_16791/g.23648  ORF Transcript_16791/g.23648 Transcript_16791/m.23648 type:complete len:711 (+) Transcript_16791:348-2480(+)